MNWIKTTDQLPEFGENVLLHSKSLGVLFMGKLVGITKLGNRWNVVGSDYTDAEVLLGNGPNYEINSWAKIDISGAI